MEEDASNFNWESQRIPTQLVANDEKLKVCRT
jgi:hypothetical protein